MNAPDAIDEAATTDVLHGAPEPHPFLQRGFARGGGGGSSPLMTEHGGPVLITDSTYAIFWGSWNGTTPGATADVATGIQSFLTAFSGTNYEAISYEYTDSTAQNHITGPSTFVGPAIFDTTAAPTRALSTSAAIAEACAKTGNNPDPNGLYFIFTSTGAGHVNYCAWHTWGSCSNGAQIQVAYMPNLSGVTGCNPQDTTSGHSEPLAALANVTAHELMETITDPRGTAWYDGGGSEIGDKCAWTFAANTLVTLSDLSQWKLQQEWSNNAYNSSLGSPRGCLQGQ